MWRFCGLVFSALASLNEGWKFEYRHYNEFPTQDRTKYKCVILQRAKGPILGE